LNKKSFLNNFTLKDENMLASLYEDVELCKKIHYPIYSRMFFPPEVWSNLVSMQVVLGIDLESKGVTEDSEKRVIMIKPKGYGESDDTYPFTYFQIIGGSKFKDLEHRHFLAAIMSLGIKREMLGDLIVREGVCYGVIMSDLYTFLETNLSSIGKTGVSVTEIDGSVIPNMEFEERTYLVSSLRLDNLVSAVTEKSRTIASELIKEGAVSINYSLRREKDLTLKEGDVMTVRKKGKFVFKEVVGISKKGKYRVVLKKYK
jgi:RNA-binding protein YlmH